MSIFKNPQQNPNHTTVMDVPVEEVQEAKDSLYLVDVRRPDELTGELGHIQGVQHIVLDELPQKIDELPKDKTIVFVCRSGARSGHATEFAKESGFSEVYNMLGGMIAWNEKNFPVEKE